MDIIKQISILLWLLGCVLLTPPVLRHFNVDVKSVYRRAMLSDGLESHTEEEPRPSAKSEIDAKIFDELFTEPPAAPEKVPSSQEDAEPELKKLITGLENVAKQSAAENLQEIPAPFYVPADASKKLRWLPPPPGFTTGETFNYLIYREKEPVSAKLKSVLDTIHGNLMLDLTPFTLVSKPSKILVMLFDDKNNYMQFTKRPSWSGAASDLRADTMYVLEGRNFYPLSVHELTHLYFDGYFLPAVSPLWLSEGMAVYMQIFASGQTPSWLDKNLRNILSGRYIPLENMMQMEELSSLSTEQAELWYTQAYSVVNYLLNERSRDEFYRFCNELKDGAAVYQALFRAYGRPFTKVSVLQNVWLLDLAKRMRTQSEANVTPKLPAEVLASTQTVSVAASQSASAQARPAQAKPKRPQPKKTVVPKLQLVDTNAYRGGF